MEKPEWFEIVEASESAPKPSKTSSARAHRVRITQGFALFGIASVIAVGGFSFAQSSNPPSTLFASAAPVATASSLPSAATPTASPTIAQTAGRPTITSAVGGEGND